MKQPDRPEHQQETGSSLSERLSRLRHSIQADPDDAHARALLYRAMSELLLQDPYLAYVEESDRLYMVRTKDRLEIAVPKMRAEPVPFPPAHASVADRLLRWCGFAGLLIFLGGFPGAAGALLIFLQAHRLRSASLTERENRRLFVVKIIAASLFIAGLLIGWIFISHF